MTDIKITQADRDAAADSVKAYRDRKDNDWQQRIRDGKCDDGTMVQAFARHRHEARAEALEEGKNNWDGLARSIMMAFDCDAKTPRAIFKHLSMVGQPVPKWMRDEAEMQNLDHVISKGTRCVLIYRAMAEPALRSGEREGA